ncbi:MAG: hypothetical protein KDC83_04065 [Flavobacteriales bacterium]|nr:hypothetical protein [Flavobacteriales bacterium]
MGKDEFLFLIPGVLYGIGIFDLLSLVRNKENYWENLLWATVMFFTLIALLFDFYEDLGKLTSNILYYTLFIFSPLFFVQSCYLISPDEKERDMKAHFDSNRRHFFISMTGVVLVNVLIQLLVTNKFHLVQSILIVSSFSLNVFFDKLYLRLIAAALITIFVLRFYIENAAVFT